MRPDRWAESWHCPRRTANRPGSQCLASGKNGGVFRTASDGPRPADGNRPYVFSAPTKRGGSAALRPLHRPPVPGARENPQRHRDCATRKRRKRRAPFPRATTTVNTCNRPQSGGSIKVRPGPRSPLRKSLDDALLPPYSSTILPMNTKFFFPIWFLSLPVMAAGSVPPKFRAVEIDTKIEIGYGVAVADVDGDGKPDILLADKKQFVWYRNPGWEKSVLAENLTREDNVCIAAADIDGDGKCEIAVGAGWNPGDTINSGAVFYLIPPKDRTQKWEPVALHHEPTVHRMRWVKNWQNEYELVVARLHGRGHKNGQGDGVKILAYKVPVEPKQPWTTRPLNDALHMTHNLDPVQWDDDAAQELLIASREGVFVLNWDPDASALKLAQLPGTDSGGAGQGRSGK